MLKPAAWLLVARRLAVLAFTLYDKDELDDLSNDQRKALKKRLEDEIQAREKS